MARWVIFAITFVCCCPLVGQNTFQRQISGVTGLFTFEQTADGHFWIGTFLGKIIRLDANGQWLGGQDLHKGDTTSVRFIYDLEKAPDNGVWALYDRNNANTALDDYLILARLNATGQPQWQTSVHYGEVLHWAHNRLATDPAGNAYVLSARFSAPGSSQPSRTIFSKVAPDGTLQWVKAFTTNQGVNYPRAFQRLSDGSFLICGNGQLASTFGFVLRVSAEGEVLWSGRYPRFLFKAFAEMPDGGCVFAATEAGPLPQANCVVRMDAQGNVLWAKRLVMPSALNWIPAIVRSPTGDVLIGNYETRKDGPVPDLICLSPTGDFKWAKHYDACHNYGISNLLVTNDGGVAALRYRAGSHLLLKTDDLGQCTTCPSDPMTISLENLTDTPLEFQWQVEHRAAPGHAECDYHPFLAEINDFCGQEKSVTGIELATNELCAYKPLAASAVGSGVADSYHWFFSGGLPATQSGVFVGGVQFANPGPATVMLATADGFCRDTFSAALTVVPGPAPFDLGPDTTVCGHVPIVFDATTSGAQTYRWDDGSTLPQRGITGSGEYSITAQGNGCTVSDTVRLERLEGLVVRLPGDTTICGQDTLWLDATTPHGDRYRWNDGVETARRSVTQQGYYAVSVYRGECSASDFVAVNLFPRPSILPADTTLCIGEPLTLTVGESVNGDIQWNGQRGYAEFPFDGVGWVRRLVTFQGCHFLDSVLVRRSPCRDGFALYAPNVFSPGHDGPNAYFELFGDDLEVLSFQVFDRWGSLVHATANGVLPHWDGTSRGRVLPAGVYIWSAQLQQRGKIGRLSGDLLLVR